MLWKASQALRSCSSRPATDTDAPAFWKQTGSVGAEEAQRFILRMFPTGIGPRSLIRSETEEDEENPGSEEPMAGGRAGVRSVEGPA